MEQSIEQCGKAAVSDEFCERDTVGGLGAKRWPFQSQPPRCSSQAGQLSADGRTEGISNSPEVGCSEPDSEMIAS
jgi:hypothetical protein